MNYKHHLDIKQCIALEKEHLLILLGWAFEKNENDFKIKICVNDKEIPFKMESMVREDVLKNFPKLNVSADCGYKIEMSIDNPIDDKEVSVYLTNSEKTKKVVQLSGKKLQKMAVRKPFAYSIDKMAVDDEYIRIAGWAMTERGEAELVPQICEDNGKEVEFLYKQIRRDDVLANFLYIDNLQANGFEIRFKFDENKNYQCIFKTKDKLKVEKVIPAKIRKRMSSNSILAKIIYNISYRNFRKTISFVRKKGLKAALRKIRETSRDEELDYMSWMKDHPITKEELEAQRNYKFSYEPLMSIIVPTYKTPEKFLHQMVDSVIKQTYSNWELCIADGSENDDTVIRIIKEYQEKDSKRIKVKALNENLGIAGNTNEALALAEGDFVCLLDHDDLLTPDALYEVVSKINENRANEVIYTDEDKVDMDLKEYFQPYFKTDFNLDLLRSSNYICHFFVVSKQIVDEVGGFRKEFDGSQDYDFILRCVEKAQQVAHIHKVLYHWRVHKDSVAENPESKMYCYEAGCKAIQAHLNRTGVKGTAYLSDILGQYRVEYEMTSNPKVSIVIPNREEKESLETCLNSIWSRSTYQNYEIVIVENNSSSDEIFQYYKEIDGKNNTKVVYWEREFNYSAINNFGVQQSSGEYILLLNNDTEVINENWLEGLLSNCMREEVGIVGAKLYYPDDTVQHAGVIVGLGGIAGHTFLGFEKTEYGYFSFPLLQRNVSAVTGACLMVKRSVFEKVGGLEERLQVAFNDIDFCLKVRQAGYLIVYNPHVTLYHYESKSRGGEDTEEKVKRFQSEIAYMQEKWQDALNNGDPYYNQNLSMQADYKLKELNWRSE